MRCWKCGFGAGIRWADKINNGCVFKEPGDICYKEEKEKWIGHIMKVNGLLTIILYLE